MTIYTFCGFPGSGKTTLAKRFAEFKQASHLNEDKILREMYPEPTHSERERQSVYEEMFARVEEVVGDGRDVVLDATFVSQKNRDTARKMAKEFDAGFKLIYVRADEKDIKVRLKKRFNADGNDATLEIYKEYKEKFDPVEEEHVLIENVGDKNKVFDKLIELTKQ